MTAQYSQHELLRWARAYLGSLEGSDPGVDARVLLEWALSVDNLWAAPQMVGAHAAERFRSAVAQRRARRPLQHIVGRMWFRHLVLSAQEGVFICRPETEVVAGAAIDEATRRAADGVRPIVVDLCTGSGAIALALATEVAGAQVHAVELMDEAVALAARNIAELAPGLVKLHHGDATSPTMLAHLDGTVDIVVSNPPYVPTAMPVTQSEASVDPATALYGGGEDGMVLPRGILTRAYHLLRPGGLLVMEHAEVQAQALREAALASGFSEVATGKDLADNDRYLSAWRG
ncbi:peptide chain release factor N(5)-glutamine methyltransferase [Schaalia suimastitidis]|uniref:peptide chain release factor N(5)-glutamine methyltransferase n=1 Tax=Schaalia suimastitidis TaxID=121163 RepID=UPI000421F14E|nr:peptide chain release factor N(5)-glutamine methyltransferase [Schaalia suimastitidis]